MMAAAQGDGTTILYRPGVPLSEQSISVKSWGGGICTETDDTAYEGTKSIRVTTKNFYQGGTMLFGKNVDLAASFGDKNNLLRITYKSLDAATGSGPSGGPGGGGKPGPGGKGGPGGGDGESDESPFAGNDEEFEAESPFVDPLQGTGGIGIPGGQQGGRGGAPGGLGGATAAPTGATATATAYGGLELNPATKLSPKRQIDDGGYI